MGRNGPSARDSMGAFSHIPDEVAMLSAFSFLSWIVQRAATWRSTSSVDASYWLTGATRWVIRRLRSCGRRCRKPSRVTLGEI
jgi:hypothetical protein